jgi:hypothetical protein
MALLRLLAHQVVAQSYQESYGQMLQQLLTDTFQCSVKKPTNMKCSMERNLLMLWCHVCDQSFVYLPEEEWQWYQSLTWKRRRGKAGTNKRKIDTG